jgi:hypothetical protein
MILVCQKCWATTAKTRVAHFKVDWPKRLAAGAGPAAKMRAAAGLLLLPPPPPVVDLSAADDHTQSLVQVNVEPHDDQSAGVPRLHLANIGARNKHVGYCSSSYWPSSRCVLFSYGESHTHKQSEQLLSWKMETLENRKSSRNHELIDSDSESEASLFSYRRRRRRRRRLLATQIGLLYATRWSRRRSGVFALSGQHNRASSLP